MALHAIVFRAIRIHCLKEKGPQSVFSCMWPVLGWARLIWYIVNAGIASSDLEMLETWYFKRLEFSSPSPSFVSSLQPQASSLYVEVCVYLCVWVHVRGVFIVCLLLMHAVWWGGQVECSFVLDRHYTLLVCVSIAQHFPVTRSSHGRYDLTCQVTGPWQQGHGWDRVWRNLSL